VGTRLCTVNNTYDYGISVFHVLFIVISTSHFIVVR
jgi:hypothetical protein